MKVFWTAEAKESFNSNLDYLIHDWGMSVAGDFLDRTNAVINHLKSNPNSFPLIRKTDQVRRCVVSKHISLYYRVTSDDQIDLLTFWNNFRDPEKLTY